MAALTSTVTPHFHNHPAGHMGAGPRDVSPFHRAATYHAKPKLALSTSSTGNSSYSNGGRGDAYSAGASPLSASSTRHVNFRKTLRNTDNKMAPFASNTSPLSTTSRSHSQHSKIQKRSGSYSVSPTSTGGNVHTSPLADPYPHFSSPFAPHEEPFPAFATPATIKESSTPKIRPYLRKMSAATIKDDSDQGRLDLSKSSSVNEALNGLGIHDFPIRSVSDVDFPHNSSRNMHARTISGGSQVSVGSTSGSLRPNQPFIHPMRQIPRPYTPPTATATTAASSHPSSLHGGDGTATPQESDDVITDDGLMTGPGFRSTRSTSISSFSTAAAPQIQPIRPPLRHANSSQTNLSTRSSGRSTRAKLLGGRPRRDTDASAAAVPLSSRTSLDKTFSFTHRRSDSIDTTTQHARISAARAAFAEKEALKDRKRARAELKRSETEAKKSERRRRQSETSREPTSPDKASITSRRRRSSTTAKAKAAAGPKVGWDAALLRSRSYEEVAPASPVPKVATRPSEKRPGSFPAHPRSSSSSAVEAKKGWLRFSAWLQTRLLRCGGGSA